MKKNIKKILLFILLMTIIIGLVFFIRKPTTVKSKQTNSNVNKQKIDVDITDNYFIAQTNDVYINYDDYDGKIVRIEGYFYVYQDYKTGQNYYAIVRNSPGCCGNDGLAGLDIKYNGEYPAEKTWIKVIGKISKYSETDPTPVIIVSSLEETEEGLGFVSN